MSTRLDQMISGARERDAGWNIDRSERVREGALRRRDGRARRDRAFRRGLLVASGAGLLVLAFLRAASSAPAERELTSSSPSGAATLELESTGPRTVEALAVRSMSDAGYARD